MYDVWKWWAYLLLTNVHKCRVRHLQHLHISLHKYTISALFRSLENIITDFYKNSIVNSTSLAEKPHHFKFSLYRKLENGLDTIQKWSHIVQIHLRHTDDSPFYSTVHTLTTAIIFNEHIHILLSNIDNKSTLFYKHNGYWLLPDKVLFKRTRVN